MLKTLRHILGVDVITDGETTILHENFTVFYKSDVKKYLPLRNQLILLNILAVSHV